MADIIVRGSQVFFSAAFVDKDGNAAAPIAATLYLAYTKLSDSTRTKTSVTMTLDGNVGSCTWDSSVAAAPSDVKWSVKGTGSNSIVTDGAFTLSANEANPTE